MMMFFDNSAISGMSWSAWRSEAAASPKPRSKAVVDRPSWRGSRLFGVVNSAASSGGPGARSSACRDAVLLDDAGVAALLVGAEGVAHRAGDELQLLLILGRVGRDHDEEAHQKRHQVGKGDEPAVAAMSAFELLAHRPAPLGRFGEFRPMVLRQVGDEYLLHQRRALRLADQEDAIDDQRSRDVLLVELDMQLVGDRQAEQVADERA